MQSQLKVLAPVITRDVSLPNSSKKVPMVIVPVPDSLSLMAIPLATLTSQMTTTTTTNQPSATAGPVSAAISAQNSITASSMDTMAREISTDIHGGRLGNNNNLNNNSASTKDEQQAKDLLNWNDDGIGTLEGCDLRFKINQLGCLELLDSEDESHPDYHHNQLLQQQQQQQTYHRSKPSNSSTQQRPANHLQATNRIQQHCHEVNQQPHNEHRVSNSSTNSNSSGSTSSSKRSKIKQITPGSSLLRDGPNNWRSRASSSSDTTTIPQTSSTTTAATSRSCTSTPLSRRVEITPNQQTILYEKLIPRKDLEEIKSKVKEWTTEDVSKFVDGIPGCAGYGQLFEFQQICGNSLLLLDLKDLTETIKIELGPALKIYNAVALMRDEIQLS